MSDIQTWFKNLPTFTRYWFGLSVAFALVGRIGLISPYSLILTYDHFIKGFQIWRPLTALFYYPLSPSTGFHYLMNLYFLYNYSLRLEQGIFSSTPGDYFYMLLFNWICIVVIALFGNIMLLMDPMVLSVLYVWCQLNKDQIVQFWFGTQFKAMYLPWVLLAFNMILSGGGIYEIVGILVGHLYFFLKFKYPQEFGGNRFLETPNMISQYFPNRSGGMAGVGQPASFRPTPNNNNARGYNWGRGQTLGNPPQ